MIASDLTLLERDRVLIRAVALGEVDEACRGRSAHPLPIDQMTDAEQAVQEAAANIPAEVCALDTAEKLSDEDRQVIVDIARTALVRFHPEPGPTPGATATPEPGAEPEPPAAVRPKPAAALKAKP